jgi:hypothetical protein
MVLLGTIEEVLEIEYYRMKRSENKKIQKKAGRRTQSSSFPLA